MGPSSSVLELVVIFRSINLPVLTTEASRQRAGGTHSPNLYSSVIFRQMGCYTCLYLCSCAQVKTEGGKIIRVEAHPIPEHPRPRRAQGRVALVGDAAGYVTKCSGEGIYFAAKSGRMCAEAIVAGSKNGAQPLNLSPSTATAANAAAESLQSL